MNNKPKTTQAAEFLLAEFTVEDLEQLRPVCRAMLAGLKQALDRDRQARHKGHKTGWSNLTPTERRARMTAAIAASPRTKAGVKRTDKV